jgi:hypothetical protein
MLANALVALTAIGQGGRLIRPGGAKITPATMVE